MRSKTASDGLGVQIGDEVAGRPDRRWFNLAARSHTSLNLQAFSAGPLSPPRPRYPDVSPVRLGVVPAGVAKFQGHDSHHVFPHVWEWPRLERQPTSARVHSWPDQTNCFHVTHVTPDARTSSLLRPALLTQRTSDAAHVAAENRRAHPAVQRGRRRLERRGWLTPAGSAHRVRCCAYHRAA